MRRWCLLLLCLCLGLPLLAQVDIVDLPEQLDERYDLTWDVTLTQAPAAPLYIQVEAAAGGKGYLLKLEGARATWQQVGVKPPLPPVSAPITLESGKPSLFTLKRRSDTVGLLQNHRLVFCAPAPSLGAGSLEFRNLPTGVTITEARYQPVNLLAFGDDFMRPEVLKYIPPTPTTWIDDPTWKVGYFLKDNPGLDPKYPTTRAPMPNPWELSVFKLNGKSVETTTANGFWYLYRGVGQSWAVVNPTMVPNFWDSYYVQAAVKTEYDGEVGLIAGYQDNNNYLLFRWQQKEYVATGKPLAELIAVVDGKRTVIASSTLGFDPVQWYTLRINLGWQGVQALVDGKVLLEGKNPGAVEGRVGLYANGAANPRRPKLDEVTASMYVTVDENTGHVVNDAADAMRTTSCIYFDDIKVGDLLLASNILTDAPYAVTKTGLWTAQDGVLQAKQPGRYVTGSATWSRYIATTRLRLPEKGSAGLFVHLDDRDNGYVWMLTPEGQRLQQFNKGQWGEVVAQAKYGVHPGEWANLRVEADGPYLALYCNSERVLEAYDPSRTAGRCGLIATKAGALFSALSLAQFERAPRVFEAHDRFETDRWLVTWSSAEADWYPEKLPARLVTPAGAPHTEVGAAAPLTTDAPGVYWHKGGHYHDVRMQLPFTAEMLAGQVVHLSSNYNREGGYRLILNREGKDLQVKLLREKEEIGTYLCAIPAKPCLLFQRRGGYLLLIMQALDTEESIGEPSVESEELVFAYHDPKPLRAEMVGFTVTDVKLPAAKLVVESDRIQDTFERSPVEWLVESGVWAVMSRYSCQPQWNWFGGFGPNTPAAWSKYRLDGDQTVEVYLGIKMQFDNQPEEYGRRYRDTNVTICADGSHLNSGYSLIRAGRVNNQPVTMLLRKGVVVWTSKDPAHLLPPQGQGHRQWFATRLEKRGKEIKVFIDNKLVTTYVDPDPLPGGYVALWTLNNGIMVGRANLSAEKMSIGAPRAAAPLAMQAELPPLPVPKVNLNDIPVTVGTFEKDFDGWKERPGLTGRLVRERVIDPQSGPNTYLKVINSYPAGDISVTAATNINLDQTPRLHLDYCFDPGARVNLYMRQGGSWYEVLLTGIEAQEVGVFTAGRAPAVADGAWHHLEADLGKLLVEAIARQTGKEATNLGVTELIFADWSTPTDVRTYGFGYNTGGTALRFDNMALLPRVKGTVTISWAKPAKENGTRTSIDASPVALPAAVVGGQSTTLAAEKRVRFFHLQQQADDGTWSQPLHLPISAGE